MSKSKTPVSIKLSSDFYLPTFTVDDNICDPNNVLLCQYDMLDVAIYLANCAPDAKILVHNFANNEQPCGGHWNMNLPENRLYSRTNLRSIIMPQLSRLYPIQDSYSQYNTTSTPAVANQNIPSVNMIITENCQIQRVASGQLLAKYIYVDIASLDAVLSPAEKNMDLYNVDKLTRYDYAKEPDKESMSARIQFLIEYAIGEQYDYLITGEWGIAELNPHWGVINLWNQHINEGLGSRLKLIFCIPIGDDSSAAAIDPESTMTYTYFSNFLIGQSDKTKDIEKIAEDYMMRKELEKLSPEEMTIKRKIYGVVWGMALGEMLSNYISSKGTDGVVSNGNVNSHTNWIISESEFTLDWDSCVDRTLILMHSLYDDIGLNILNLAKKYIAWKSGGIVDIPNHVNTCQEPLLRNIIAQTTFAQKPLDTAMSVYQSKGSNEDSHVAIGANPLHGIFKDYARRSVVACKMFQPSTACQVACLVQAYIINCIWNGKYITMEDWGYLIAQCNRIFDSNKQTSVSQKVMFDEYWSIGRNYRYQMAGGIAEYIRRTLGPTAFRAPNHTFIAMALSIIILYDIQGHIYVGDSAIRDLTNVAEFPMIDDQFRDKTIFYKDILPRDYYFHTMQTVAQVKPNSTCCAVVGSILGVACYEWVYNDDVVRDIDGHTKETDSQKWVKYAENTEWLCREIDIFTEHYIEARRGALLQKRRKEDMRTAQNYSYQPIDLKKTAMATNRIPISSMDYD
jgi:hypothetical protein